MINDCVTSGLEVFVPDAQNPWNKARLQHFFLRIGFGITPEEMVPYLQISPAEVVDQIIDDAIDLPLAAEPYWSNWALSDYDNQEQAIEHIFFWIRKWLSDMYDHGLREKMALFWHNHFVTSIDDYFCPSYMYQYHKLLQKHALGNFREFTQDMGTTPAMLIYLNGVQNTRFQPNENYARELLELFTLGRDNNYTEDDIKEIARALTGWNGFSEACAPIGYVPFLHDPGSKTIFGQTANFNYESLHDLLFEERKEEIADRICRKILLEFVGKEINEDILEGLKQVFLENDFEIAPVLRTLFKSAYFFDAEQLGTKISSPIELLIKQSRQLGIKPQDADFMIIYSVASQLNQQLLSPPDVSGWAGDQNWLNSSLLAIRWSVLENYIGLLYFRNRDLFGVFGRAATSHFNEVDLVCKDIIHHLMPWGLPFPSDYEAALDAFKGEIPQNYFEDGSWNTEWETLPDQVALLLVYLVKQPEYQLI